MKNEHKAQHCTVILAKPNHSILIAFIVESTKITVWRSFMYIYHTLLFLLTGTDSL